MKAQSQRAMVDPPPPLCESCNHCHVQGVKCDVCGHTGRSLIYPKMKARALERRSLRSVFYDGAELFGSNSSALENTWDLLVEARLSAYFTNGSPCNKDVEFTLEEERQSKHYVMYAGDALVSSGRYHISPLPDGKLFVSIDRFCIQLPYRGKGFAERGLKEIIASAMSQCGSRGAQAVVGIQAPTTLPSVVVDRLLHYGFVQTSTIPLVQRGGVAYVTVVHSDTAALVAALSTVA